MAAHLLIEGKVRVCGYNNCLEAAIAPKSTRDEYLTAYYLLTLTNFQNLAYSPCYSQKIELTPILGYINDQQG